MTTFHPLGPVTSNPCQDGSTGASASLTPAGAPETLGRAATPTTPAAARPKSLLVIGRVQDGHIQEYTIAQPLCDRCQVRAARHGNYCDGCTEIRLDDQGVEE